MEDPIANGWRLLKAALSAYTPSKPEKDTTEGKEDWQSHPTETVVAAQLLELVERESARRFVIHTGGKYGLLVRPYLTLPYASSTPKGQNTNR